MGIRFAVRSYFSKFHIYTAVVMARHAGNIEKNISKKERNNQEHRAYVLSAIISSVAFLEATINEFFTDIAEGYKESTMAKDIDPNVKEFITKMWDQGIPRTARYSVLQKYEIALLLTGFGTLDKGFKPYHDIKILTELRNALIHYEPEWVLGDIKGSEPEHILGRRLKGLGFNDNPLTGEGNPYYPDKCLGFGCAVWAVESSILFADNFFEKININAPYMAIRNKLKIER